MRFPSAHSAQWQSLSSAVSDSNSRLVRYRAAERVVEQHDRAAMLPSARLKSLERIRRKRTNLGLVRVRRAAVGLPADPPAAPASPGAETLEDMHRERRASMARLRSQFPVSKGVPEELHELEEAFARVNVRRSLSAPPTRAPSVRRLSSRADKPGSALPRVPVEAAPAAAPEVPEVESPPAPPAAGAAKPKPKSAGMRPKPKPKQPPKPRATTAAPRTRPKPDNKTKTTPRKPANWDRYLYPDDELQPGARFFDFLGTAAARLPCPVAPTFVALPEGRLVWLEAVQDGARGWRTRRVDVAPEELAEAAPRVAASLLSPATMLGAATGHDAPAALLRRGRGSPAVLGEARRAVDTAGEVAAAAGEAVAVQKYVKARGAHAWAVRAVHRAERGGKVGAYYLRCAEPYAERAFFAQSDAATARADPVSGPHAWAEPRRLCAEVARAVQRYEGIKFDEFVADFAQDEGGQWWLLGVKAFVVRPAVPKPVQAPPPTQQPKAAAPPCAGDFCEQHPVANPAARTKLLFKHVLAPRLAGRRPANRAELQRMYQLVSVCQACEREYGLRAAAAAEAEERMAAAVAAAAGGRGRRVVAPGQTRVEREFARQQEIERGRVASLCAGAGGGAGGAGGAGKRRRRRRKTSAVSSSAPSEAAPSEAEAAPELPEVSSEVAFDPSEQLGSPPPLGFICSPGARAAAGHAPPTADFCLFCQRAEGQCKCSL